MHYFKPFLKIGSICFMLLFLTQCSDEDIELNNFPQDIDGDNIVDDDDNCFDISNPQQEDNDNDVEELNMDIFKQIVASFDNFIT